MVSSFYHDEELRLDHIVVDPELIKALELKKQEKDVFFKDIIAILDREFIVATRTCIQQLEKKIDEAVRKLSTEQREAYLREINNTVRPSFDHDALKAIQAMREMQTNLSRLAEIRQRYQAAIDALTQWKENTWLPGLKKITAEFVAQLSNPLAILQEKDRKALDPHWQAMRAGIAESLATRAGAVDLIKHLPHVRDQFLQVYHKQQDVRQAVQQVIDPIIQRNTTIVCAGKAVDFFRKLPQEIQKRLAGSAVRFGKSYAESENCRIVIDRYIKKLDDLNVSHEVANLQVDIAKMGFEMESLIKILPAQLRQLQGQVVEAARGVIHFLTPQESAEQPEPGMFKPRIG